MGLVFIIFLRFFWGPSFFRSRYAARSATARGDTQETALSRKTSG
jgi:hypothetical protein